MPGPSRQAGPICGQASRKVKPMVTCPWCGTSYATFESNCERCGGTMPPLAEDIAPGLEAGLAGAAVPTPPPPPRPVSGGYVWRLLTADGWAIACLVFGLVGAIFTLVGVPLALAVITAFVGIPFAGLGLLFLGGAAVVGVWRYREARQAVEVLRTGEAVEGRIVEVAENMAVRINGRNPWAIRYEFSVGGRPYEGRVSTLTAPGAALQPGQPACVLYLPQAPEQNGLYPHP